MDILFIIIYFLALLLCSIFFLKAYKRELQKYKEQEDYNKSLEHRLGRLEQRLYDFVDNFDNYKKGV